jgi:hypothetical protein
VSEHGRQTGEDGSGNEGRPVSGHAARPCEYDQEREDVEGEVPESGAGQIPQVVVVSAEDLVAALEAVTSDLRIARVDREENPGKGWVLDVEVVVDGLAEDPMGCGDPDDRRNEDGDQERPANVTGAP